MKVEDKLKIYQFLGAEKFQKLVFLVEDIKYEVIDKFFPNIISWYDEIIDKKYYREMKKSNKNDNNQELLMTYKREKLLFRKELVQRKNRNYHYNKNYPTQIIEYLKANKKIHQIGIVRDIGALLLLGIYCLSPLPKFSLLILVFGIYEFVSLFIDFQCINLQNYNLCRFEEEKTIEKLKKLESRTIIRNIEKMEHCLKPVSEVVSQSLEVPTVDMVVDNITTKEQALELLKYAKHQLNSLNDNTREIVNKQKKIGERKNV